jgi:hypothetical protein
VRSDIDLLGYCQSVIDFDAQVAHGALDLGMAEQELHRSKIAGAAINQRSLGPSQRMGPKQAWIETDVVNPTTLAVYQKTLQHKATLSRGVLRPVGLTGTPNLFASERPLADRYAISLLVHCPDEAAGYGRDQIKKHNLWQFSET